MRAALLTNILTPYRVPVYQALSGLQKLAPEMAPEIQWRIFTNAPTEFDRSWQIDARDLDVESVRTLKFLRPSAVGNRDRRSEQKVTTYFPFGLMGALRRYRPDVVVSAELGLRTLIALGYCKLYRIPLVIWSYHSRSSAAAIMGEPDARDGSRIGLANRLRRWMLANADAVIGMGRQAREVLITQAVSNDRIFDAPNAHDSESFETRLAAPPNGALRDALDELGCRKNVALVVGRLIPVKGIAELLDAWNDLPPVSRADWSLLFVGDGPLAETIYRAARSSERGEILHLPAVQAAELVDHYRLASVLVFPSLGDPWGLVVNEAFACGVPVVCSRYAGCADDLVIAGQNGWIVDPTDPAQLSATLREALHPTNLEPLRDGARKTAARFSPANMADGMLSAVRSAIARRRTR